jgi:hypothetical protein
MILSASDICIAVTLVVNSLALLSSGGKKRGTTSAAARERSAPELEAYASETGETEGEAEGENLDESESEFETLLPLHPALSPNWTADSRRSFAQKLQRLALTVRKYSCFLVLYNLLFFCLMVLVFRE